MIEIKGKVYRNIQEQVGKNKEDIETLKTDLQTNEEAISDIQEALPYKQDKLTAGDNITIANNVISADGTTYTAGTGIIISSNDELSVDTETIATISALQSFSESFGGALQGIYSGTSIVGKARCDENGNDIDVVYATKSEIKKYYEHSIQFLYEEANGDYYSLDFKVISTRSTAYTKAEFYAEQVPATMWLRPYECYFEVGDTTGPFGATAVYTVALLYVGTPKHAVAYVDYYELYNLPTTLVQYNFDDSVDEFTFTDTVKEL